MLIFALEYSIVRSVNFLQAELTNRLFVTMGTAIIGTILLSTGSMLYSIAAMLKGKIRQIFRVGF